MPRFSLSTRFERKLVKDAKKDSKISGDIIDALNKFVMSPVPASLHFKPVPGTTDRYYIRITNRRGWRIVFRKIDGGLYEAIEFGDHDIRRQGNL